MLSTLYINARENNFNRQLLHVNEQLNQRTHTRTHNKTSDDALFQLVPALTIASWKKKKEISLYF